MGVPPRLLALGYNQVDCWILLGCIIYTQIVKDHVVSHCIQFLVQLHCFMGFASDDAGADLALPGAIDSETLGFTCFHIQKHPKMERFHGSSGFPADFPLNFMLGSISHLVLFWAVAHISKFCWSNNRNNDSQEKLPNKNLRHSIFSLIASNSCCNFGLSPFFTCKPIHSLLILLPSIYPFNIPLVYL